jgi:hypothetical protein
MTDEEREEVAILMVEIRGLAMGFASRVEDLRRVEELATRAESMVWFIDPTMARDKAGAIDRHVRLVKASHAFARQVRALLFEELAEVSERARRAEGLD